MQQHGYPKAVKDLFHVSWLGSKYMLKSKSKSDERLGPLIRSLNGFNFNQIKQDL